MLLADIYRCVEAPATVSRHDDAYEFEMEQDGTAAWRYCHARYDANAHVRLIVLIAAAVFMSLYASIQKYLSQDTLLYCLMSHQNYEARYLVNSKMPAGRKNEVIVRIDRGKHIEAWEERSTLSAADAPPWFRCII